MRMRGETNDSPLFSPVTSFRDVSIDFISRGCIIAMRSHFKACSWNRNFTASCLDNPFMDDRTYIRTSLRDPSRRGLQLGIPSLNMNWSKFVERGKLSSTVCKTTSSRTILRVQMQFVFLIVRFTLKIILAKGSFYLDRKKRERERDKVQD